MKDKIIDSLTIQQYMDRTLDARKMHELEKQSLEDEFLADALEGYTYVIEPAEKLTILQQRLADRILEQQVNKKAFGITAQRLSIAAASGLMFILAATLFWMNGYQTPGISKKVEVNLSAQVPAQSNTVEVSKQTIGIANSIASPIFALAKQSLSRSEPVAGWNEYIKYIHNNIPKPAPLKDGVKDIVIAFKISRSGAPVELKIINGTSDQYSDEVIRVIKNGPLWKAVDSEEVKIQVGFKK